MDSLKQKLKSIVIIPGSGEFVYSPNIVYDKSNTPLNAYSTSTKSNIVLTIEHLRKDFPNLENVSILVGWFANGIDAKSITITPKVESKTPIQGEDWQVANYTRSTAELVLHTNGIPNWGGTPTDKSIIEVCELLTTNGYNVTLYPILFIDQPSKPWRGFIQASSDHEVEQFFKEYSKFIMHYASLKYGDKELKNYISNFIIGSEFKELLKYRNSNQEFTAVDKLTLLADKVKSQVGNNVKLTYAANWDEYHHTNEGWHHLDPLWASNNIDFIGINAYFPLTDNLPQDKVNYELIKKAGKAENTIIILKIIMAK